MENKNSWTMAWFTDKGWTDRWERLSSPKEVESQLRYIEDDPYACSLKNVKIIPPEADIYSMDPGEFFKYIEKGTIDAGPVMIVSKNRGADVYTSYETVDGTVKAAHRLVRAHGKLLPLLSPRGRGCPDRHRRRRGDEPPQPREAGLGPRDMRIHSART